MSSLSRREFFRSGATLATGALVAPSLGGLVACAERVATDPLAPGLGPLGSLDVLSAGYGNLAPAGPELALPAGFQYVVLGQEGAIMSDGYPTPGFHDGMGAFGLPNGNTLLIRNHENKLGAHNVPAPIGPPGTAYDLKGGGGTTSIEVAYPGGVPTIVRDFVSCNGTSHNCAGGPTPWGSWLTCEETTQGPTQGRLKKHGYVYDVSSLASGPVTPIPLTGMGRFSHEAVAIDPTSGIYLTEDTDPCGFYRFIPKNPANLAAGGTLQMLRLASTAKADMRQNQPVGVPRKVKWVKIPNPDPANAETNHLAVFNQGYAAGGARFMRLEGCWYGDQSIYFISKKGGNKRLGQVWRYIHSTKELILVYESTSASVLDGPGNVTVSPRGGLVLCEDGSGTQFVQGLDAQGNVFPFAQNILNNREFCGACYSPDGQYLFVNVQGNLDAVGATPSYTFAIWGPWGTGKL
jgi:secreted PhoX family phosphatase